MPHPSGTVTFLFSDIEGSSARWERDRDAMSAALARHDALMRAALDARGAYIFKTAGDEFCAAFARPQDAMNAASDAQRLLAGEDFSAVGGMFVRMALHTGTAEERDGNYFGPVVNRVARLLAIGHGGQVLLSGTTSDLLQTELPPDYGLRDLGAHRLKDLAQPERVYQLLAPHLPELFPALRSVDAFPNNLPLQSTSFVGREHDASEIKELLKNNRLVTLVGTGGSGKTRCAIQVGAELLEGFVGGVWLSELAPISDASMVTAEIARTLGVREVPNQPLRDSLLGYLKRQRLLLILDNCEHVLDEARAVLAAIMRSCPEVRVLTTSRERLSVGGEQVFRLPPLALPPEGKPATARSALRYGAVTLFTDRALATDAHFALTDENAPDVTEICRRLDGIPLAIELAAARVTLLSPQQIAQKLGARFRMLTGGDRSALPRQQTLRATIDWSFDLLDERERALFRRLSIFAGGWTLPAVAQVCTGDAALDEWDVLESISLLVDKSLVVAESLNDERRYRMLGSIREYGLECLAEAGEMEAIAAKHASFYAAFVRDLRPVALALEDLDWKGRIGCEIDNIRAAIEWTIVKGHEPEVGLSLLAEMEWPELVTTPQEALRWFEAAAGYSAAMPSELVHARILRHCVLLEWLVGRPLAQLERTGMRAIEVARTTNDPDEIARALANLGACYRSSARFDEAEEAFVEAYKTPESLSRITTNAVLRLWAVTDLQRHDVDVARRRFSEVARLERPGSEAHATALLHLGELEFAAGNIRAARDAALAAKETYARLNSVYLVLLLSNLAAYAIAADDIDDAREHLREALHLQLRAGPGWLGTVLEHHALFAVLLEDRERAVVLAGFTDALYVSRGQVRQYTEGHGHERLMRLLAQAFSADELARRMLDGARLTEEQALAHAAAIHDATKT
ncbi:MAG: adenylate/guanylate cyclase domain-containing protein [Candidatus Tumulicola sp.]